MKNPDEIRNIALERLEEATILCDAEKYDGAFYLAGYSVELMLKAKICENFCVENLFIKTKIDGVKKDNFRKLREAVKLHNIDVLLVFSGLRDKLNVEKSKPDNDDVLNKTIARLLDAQKGWSEQSRYQPVGSQNGGDVKELIDLLLDEKGLIRWIQNN